MSQQDLQLSFDFPAEDTRKTVPAEHIAAPEDGSLLEGIPEPEVPVRRNQPRTGTLYLRLPGEEGKLFPKIKAILNMFPGDSPAVLYFADTKQRRGTRCALMEPMLQELKNVLGEANVVLK